jgi:hypothetical protein
MAGRFTWKPFSWCSRQTVFVLTLRPEAVWKSTVSVLTEDRRFMCHFMSLCGLPLRSWAIVAAWCFHFIITAIKVERGSSSRAEMWRTDLLERWTPMTVPRWKSVGPFYCQCLAMKIARLCARFYTPVNNGCGWNPQIHFEGVSTYFCIYSVCYNVNIFHIFHFVMPCFLPSDSYEIRVSIVLEILRGQFSGVHFLNTSDIQSLEAGSRE